MVESLFNVFENIYDPFNFELDKTEDTTTLVNVTSDVVLNEEMSNTKLLSNKTSEKEFLDGITNY